MTQTRNAPDQVPLTKSQAARLAGLTGIDASAFAGRSVADLASAYKWIINPDFFLFRQICGQVVQTDPASGVHLPVPNATVNALDTTCNLLGYFPGPPWIWFFPFHCETEQVASTTTDGCGNFCIWVPNFEIEWILRFRLQRICYLELFTKPTIGGVLQYLQGQKAAADAASVTLKPNTALYQKAASLLGANVARQLAAAGGNASFGSVASNASSLLARPAFTTPLAPPLPRHLRRKQAHTTQEAHHEAVHGTLATQLAIDTSALRGLNLGQYYGPFLACVDIVIPEWVPVLELPDITLQVTQDINGSGTQTVIYPGGLFDIPWGTGNIANVTLQALPNAVASVTCNAPSVPCGDVPSLEYVGLMPLTNPGGGQAPYIDPVAGLATRPNAPRPSGTLTGPQAPPGSAPFAGTLQLYGCTQVDGAAYYRLTYAYTPPGAATPTAPVPFTGLTWPLTQGSQLPLWPVADANGWYPVLPANSGWNPENLVLEWDTVNFPDGLYTVQLQVADSGKNLLASSAAVGLTVDNAVPAITYSAIWSFAPDFSNPQPVPTDDCVVIDRGTTPADVYIQLTFSASQNYLRQVSVGTGGCANANLLSPVTSAQHWYEDAGDTSFSGTLTYQIPASFAQGVYSFGVYADTRAFNPAGGDGGQLDDWNYNPGNYTYGAANPSFAVAIVNE